MFQKWTQEQDQSKMHAEYKHANEMICLEHKWMTQTKLQNVLTAIGIMIQAKPGLDKIFGRKKNFETYLFPIQMASRIQEVYIAL
jgi:hypothetical protein